MSDEAWMLVFGGVLVFAGCSGFVWLFIGWWDNNVVPYLMRKLKERHSHDA